MAICSYVQGEDLSKVTADMAQSPPTYVRKTDQNRRSS